jgi:hypothetical protein
MILGTHRGQRGTTQARDPLGAALVVVVGRRPSVAARAPDGGCPEGNLSALPLLLSVVVLMR